MADDGGGGCRNILVATPGFEAALIAELVALRPGAAPAFFERAFPGIVNIDVEVPRSPDGPANQGSADPIDPIFARQQLPAAKELNAPSVAALTEAAYAQVERAVDHTGGAFTIHAFAPTGAEPGLRSRADLIASELLARLQNKRRRATRAFVTADQAIGQFGDIKLLIQVLLVSRTRGWVSAAAPRPLAGGGWDLAPWPGGIAPVVEDRRPPSRAYRKLEEAFLWMGAEPRQGELCVDLGGAPGGWSYTALRRGARVIAVDRAPLEPPVSGHSRLTMIEGNAFTYEPSPEQVPVDWLLSDVICEPARALAQIRRWTGQRWCRRLVTTVKFKGQDGYGMLGEVRAALVAAGCRHARIKHLHHNKNEVTVMATVMSPAKEDDASSQPTRAPTRKKS